jgi:hypothetical protein
LPFPGYGRPQGTCGVAFMLVHQSVEIIPSIYGDDGSGLTYGGGIASSEPAWMLASA